MIIFLKNPPNWPSAEFLLAHLREALANNFEADQLYSLTKNDKRDIETCARKIEREKPEWILFADFRPPSDLLNRIAELVPASDSPKLLFLAYGNIEEKAAQWMWSEKALKNRPVGFITPSRRHSLRLQSILSSPKRATETRSFSYDDRAFEYVHSASPKFFRALYTGRISLQKNVLLLIESFLKATRGIDAQLSIAGTFDDIGLPLFGIKPLRFGTCLAFHSYLDSLSADDRKKIRFLGSVSKPRLKRLYNESHLFVSLGLHHDEDFGLAPLEALGCGCPALLTDWGGFADFKTSLARDVELARVGLGAEGLEIDLASFEKSLRHHAQRTEDAKTRAERARRTRKLYGSAALKQRFLDFKQVPTPRFDGFTAEFRKVAKKTAQQKPVYRLGHLDPAYIKAYGMYVSRSQGSKAKGEPIAPLWKAQINGLKRLAPLQVRRSKTLDHGWPATIPHLAPGHTVFLSKIESRRALPEGPLIFVRDGTHELRAYFKRNPKPPAHGRVRLGFHVATASVVPRAWRSSCFWYSLEAREIRKRKSKSLLVVTQSMKLVRSLDLKRYSKIEVVNILEGDSSKYKQLANMLGATVISWHEFISRVDLTKSDFLIFDSTRVCADNGIAHICLARGAQAYEHVAMGSVVKRFALSNLHDYVIRDLTFSS